MILGEKFVWAHMPKTGGNSAATMFGMFSGNLINQDDLSKHVKHETFNGREKRTGTDCTNRTRIMNIRRLGNWALSLAQHQFRYSKIEMSIEELAIGKVRINNGKGGYKLHHMDMYLSNFMCGRVDKWIRTEYLPDDFIKVMSEFFDISKQQQNDIHTVISNVNNRYKKNISNFFSSDQLQSMYKSCPKWAQLEQNLYGDTMISSWQ